MSDRQITVKSTIKGTVNLYDLYSRLDITWDKKGAKRRVNLDKLQEAIWTPGVSNLFTDGYLIIDEPDAHDLLVELGLEQPEEEEQIMFILTDAQRKRLLSTAPFAEFKETFNKLNYEQRMQLADFAIENKLTDFDKCEYMKNAIGTDVITAIRLNADDEK